MLSRDGGARGRKLRTEVWSRCGDQKNGFLARDRSVSPQACTNHGAIQSAKKPRNLPQYQPFRGYNVRTAIRKIRAGLQKSPPCIAFGAIIAAPDCSGQFLRIRWVRSCGLKSWQTESCECKLRLARVTSCLRFFSASICCGYSATFPFSRTLFSAGGSDG